jgi:hypothetical protein
MSAPNDGGPAFPCAASDGLGRSHLQEGMTLRDWFAGQEQLKDWEDAGGGSITEALAGPRPNWQIDPVGYIRWEARWRAAIKYIRADAMLAVRARKEDEQ